MEDVIPPDVMTGKFLKCFEKISKTGQIIGIHAENSDLINNLTKKYEKSGKNDYETFLASRPNLAEELTIQTGIAMAKKTSARLHILHVSTAEGVKLIREAQREGYPITAETCPHYLFLTNEDYKKIGPVMKVYPLVKYKKDQEAIWEGIKMERSPLFAPTMLPILKMKKVVTYGQFLPVCVALKRSYL